jgi:hypothetical protein
LIVSAGLNEAKFINEINEAYRRCSLTERACGALFFLFSLKLTSQARDEPTSAGAIKALWSHAGEETSVLNL